MGRYERTFRRLRGEGRGALVPFLVLGDPDPETSLDLLEELLEAGADMLELGLPFSDPVADGPTIQRATQRALEAGMTPQRGFELIRELRRRHPEVPIGLLAYTNTAHRMGPEAFYRQAAASGVDSVLLADLPVEEAGPFCRAASAHGVAPIFLVTPTTSDRRLPSILAASTAFVYVVSVPGVTGARERLEARTLETLRRVRAQTDLPLLVGFGVSRPEHIPPLLRAGADGVIVGSALIARVEQLLLGGEATSESGRGSRRAQLREVGRWLRALRRACACGAGDGNEKR